MKKSFLIYLVALLLVTGIFGYVVWSQNKAGKTNTNSKLEVETYKNSTYGYSFNHPASLNVYEGEGVVYLAEDEYQNDDQPIISINVNKNSDSNENIENWFNSSDHGYTLLSTRIFEWLDQEGLLVRAESDSVYGPIEITEHYALSPDKRFVYNVRYNFLKDSEDQLSETYDQVIESFKFGEGIVPDVSGWLTYTDSQYGYSFMYPEEFSGEKTEIIGGSVEESQKSIALKIVGSERILMSTDVYRGENLTPQEFYESKLIVSDKEISAGTDWMLDNRIAYQVSLREPRNSDVVVPNGDYMIVFSQKEANEDEALLFEQILSTASFE